MNKIKIATAFDDKIKIYCVDSTRMVEDARLAHNLYPTASAALGRTMTMTAIMASMLKNPDEKIITQFNGGGPLGTMMVVANGALDVKGFVGDNEVYLKYNDSNKLAVGLAVGTEGYLKVTKDLNLKDSFTGTVKIQSGEIGDDFAYYFAVSEQIRTLVAIGVLVDVDYSIKAAGGLFIQVMPDCDEDTLVKLEEISKTIKPISGLIADGNKAEDIIKMYFEDAKILEEKEARWHCDCSRDRFKAALSTLQVYDLQEMIEEDGGAEVKCEYCNKTYNFSKEDLETILEFKKNV